MYNKNNTILRMDKLVFDKIEFNRLGISSEYELKLKIQATIARRQKDEVYKVSLELHGEKPDEYQLEIVLTGYFVITDQSVPSKIKEDLISKNAIAILMPYVRSEVSLLTAQPGMECVVLPTLNINNMFDK